MSDDKSTKEKMAERMAKMKALHKARNEARNQNHNEVKKEVERFSLPKNWQLRQKKAEWLIKDKETQEAVEAKGLDYERVKLLNVSALEQEVNYFKFKDPAVEGHTFFLISRKSRKQRKKEKLVIKDLQIMRHRQQDNTSVLLERCHQKIFNNTMNRKKLMEKNFTTQIQSLKENPRTQRKQSNEWLMISKRKLKNVKTSLDVACIMMKLILITLTRRTPS